MLPFSLPQERLFDVVGIGNAIVDVMAYVEDRFLEQQGMRKATMTLVDADRAHGIYTALGACTECSGGSVANSMAGIASFGGSAAFIGKTSSDALGDIFHQDLERIGVTCRTSRITDPKERTAHCLIAVTPDAERTMNTFLGVSNRLDVEDIDESLIAQSKILYIEGYLWDSPGTIHALRHAIRLARKHGVRVAFTLSDVFCVERHRESFLGLVDHKLDIVFANEAELCALYETNTLEQALLALQGRCALGVVTKGAAGSVLLTHYDRTEIPASPISQVIDTTGAGDLYASGVLFGLTHGLGLRRAGELGSLAASEVIAHLGARVMKPLKGMV
jgi:sugar/nucleoside kinase (ribokinase family)